MLKLILASENRKKIRELETLIGQSTSENITVATLSDIGYTAVIPETGATFEENALIKARVAASLGYCGVADDSGLAVDILGGEPGVYSARYASDGGGNASDAANNAKLLEKLRDVPEEKRTARFVCAVACVFPDGGFFTVHGEAEGLILNAPRGANGFGYDPLFYFPALGKTFAELTAEEKNAVSHRGAAIRKFIEKFIEITGVNNREGKGDLNAQ